MLPARPPGRQFAVSPRITAVVTVGLAVVGVLYLSAQLFSRGEKEGPRKAVALPVVSPGTVQPGVTACDAEAPPDSVVKSFRRPPPMRLSSNSDYLAVVHTSCGDIKLNLLERQAPRAVNNFIFLARQGFYNGLTWHQVIPDFIIQTGDPNGQNGSPPDGPGYTIADEIPRSPDAYTYGAVGFANTGQPDTAGSQFFIVVHDYERALEDRGRALAIRNRYTIFGRVLPAFFGSVEHIARQPRVGGNDPVESVKPAAPIYVERVEIIQRRK